jgi:cytochrome c peroxidase
VPRNPDIPANADPSYNDMGICRRADHPLPDSAQFCGMFKVPTLRNVAIRKVFFHNGTLKSLREVLNFYNTRDTQPQLWYPIVNGVVQKFDDLPAQYRANIDTQVPLDGRAVGSQPPMSAQDLDDLEAFLDTLTDADVVSQVSSAQAVPALGTTGSAMRMLLLTLLVAALLSIACWAASPMARRARDRPYARALLPFRRHVRSVIVGLALLIVNRARRWDR